MFSLRIAAWAVATSCCCLLLIGCSSQGSKPLAPVKGKVTFNGKPVAGAIVQFTPLPAAGELEPGKPASGKTNDQGEFVLTTYDPDDGAVVGVHQVVVGEEDPKLPVPGKVAADFTLDVKPEGNDFHIELIPK